MRNAEWNAGAVDENLPESRPRIAREYQPVKFYAGNGKNWGSGRQCGGINGAGAARRIGEKQSPNPHPARKSVNFTSVLKVCMTHHEQPRGHPAITRRRLVKLRTWGVTSSLSTVRKREEFTEGPSENRLRYFKFRTRIFSMGSKRICISWD
jgi:hypothetical protein